METQSPRSQSALQQYSPNSQSRTSKFFQKVSNLKVRIRFSSSTTRNPKDLDTPTNHRAAGNGRGGLNLFHNPYPSQGQLHTQHRRTPSADTYTYDGTMKPYMSQPSMLGNMIVEPFVPNSTQNEDDEGDDADSMHIVETPTQTPTQTRRFPFGRQKNSSQRSISQGLLPATGLVVGAAQAQSASRTARRSGDVPDGLPTSQTGARPRTASQPVFDGLPRSSQPPIRPPSQLSQVSNAPSHNQVHAQIRTPPARPSQDTHRTTPSIVISDPSESFDNGVSGTAAAQHNYHQDQEKDVQRPRSSLGSGDYSGLGTNANARSATPDFHANPHAHPLAHSYIPSHGRPSSSRSTASTSNTGSISVNGHERVTRPSAPRRPSSTKSSGSEVSYVSAVSQLVDALDNADSKVSGNKGMTNASHVIGQPHVHEQVSTSAVALPQVPAPTRSSSDATILASASSASDHINGLVSGRSSSPLPPRKDSLPMAPPATGTSTSTTPSKRPRPPSRPLPPPPPSEDGDVKGCSEFSHSHVSSHPPLDAFTFPTASAQDSPRPPSSYVIHEEPQQSPASIQSARPTLKQRTSSSSLKRVGQAITRKLSIGKLRKDSGGENDRRPSITSPSRQPQPPLPQLNPSISANDVPAISTMAPTPTADLANGTPTSASPISRTPPPRLTLPTYSHRFSLTTFTGGAITFSNDDTGTPTLEVPTSPGGTNLSWAAGGAARLSPSVILRPPPLPIKNLPRLPTVQGLGSFRAQGSASGSGGRTVREGSDATVVPKGNDAGRVRLRSMPELLLTGPSRRGTMEDEQEESDDDDDMMSDEEDEDEDGRPRRSEDRAGTALSNYTVSSFDHDDDASSHSHSYSADLPDSGRPSMSSYAGSTLLVPPSTSPTRRRKGGKTHSRSSSYNFDASSVEDSPTSHRSSLGSEEQQSPGAEGKGKGKERRLSGARPSLTVMTEPIRAKPLRSPTFDLNLGDGLDIGYIIAATEQAEQNILGEESTITSNKKDLKGKGRMQEAPTPVDDDDDAIDTGRTPTASGLSSGKSYYQDYFSSKQVPPPLPADAADIKAKHSQTQPTTPRVPPPPSPARTPRLEDAIRGSTRFSVGMPPLPGAGLVSRPSIYKHASRSMIDFHALAVKEERDRMVKEEEERQEKEERARRRKSVRRSAAMLGDSEPLQHAFAAFEGGAIPEDGVAPEPKRVSRVVENAADGVLARDRSSIVGPKQNRFSKAPPYEAVLEALKAEGREEPQLAGMPLRRRRSLPTFNANTEPPPYPSFFPRGGARIEPRDDEGQERLPAYYNHIYMCGVVPRKMEFVAAGQQAKDRKWRKVVCVLEGTSFKIYKYRPHGGAIGEWFRSKKNSSSANLPISIAKEDSTSSTTSRNKLGEREEGQVVELKDFPNTSRPDTPVTPTRAQPRLARDSPASSSSNVASGSRVNAGPSSNNRSRLGNLLGRSHNRSQSEATSNFLTPARSPRPSLNLPSSSSDSSGFPSGNSFGEASSQSSQHLSVPGSSPAPSTRPTTPSSFMSNQRSPSRAETRHSISSDEEPHNPHHTTIIGVGTAGGTGPLQAPTETGELLKEYSMQHAESGLGNDYIKRTNVIRVRLEGEQFLIQANNTMEVVAWIEALQAAANIALDLDERPMPKGPLFPRRRRRRRRIVTETDSGPADANHTPIMVDTT